MNKLINRSILPVLIFLALSWYLFFFRLDAIGLTDPDETFYAQTSKEMLSRDEWLTPHILGKPQFEKPIFFYWLLEISFKIFGINETAARIPSAVFGMIGIAATYLLGSFLFNRRTGILAAVMLATCVEYVILSRACVTDMTLSSLMLLGVLFFFYGQRNSKIYAYLLSSVFFALAVLTKGPMAVMLPGLALLLYFVFTKDWKSFIKIPFLPMAVVFIAVAAPWYMAMYKIHGNVFIDAFFGFQNVTRFIQSEHKIGSQVYYNIPVFLCGFFPWSIFFLFGLWQAFKKKAVDRQKGIVFALAWFATIFLFFTASSTKLPTYIFPCFAAAALITAAFWDDFLKDHPSEQTTRRMRGACYVLAVVVVLGIAGASIYLNEHYSSLLKMLFVPYLMLLLGVAMSLVAFLNGKRLLTFVFIAYAILSLLYPVLKLVLPELDRFETSRAVAGKLGMLMLPGERLGTESRYTEGLAFYTGYIPETIDKDNSIVDFMSGKDRVWCVLKEKNYLQIRTPDIYMVYKMGKRAIVTNRLPADGKYLAKTGDAK